MHSGPKIVFYEAFEEEAGALKRYLDVFDQESALAVALRTGLSSVDPQFKSTLALARKDHVILTPHNAFNTIEAVARKSEQSIEQVRHFLETGEFLWPVR